MDHSIKLLIILTFGFVLASIFGYVAQRIKLPTILGFLIAGYLIGPYSPGYVADYTIAEQLAEIGVVLMLFSVGMHFQLKDLVRVRRIAIPGAFIQTTVATIVTTLFVTSLGWTLISGIILGVAIGVASTFVMARVLSDYDMLKTTEGHIAIGWLVVEDIVTVVFLLLLPMIVIFQETSGSTAKMVGSVALILAKFFILCLFMFTLGFKIVAFILKKVAQLRSDELFTLTVLALVFLIALGSAFAFGTSIALGAFIAGMVIGKTNVKHQAAAQSLPLKDTFTIIFFLSIGMLFNPMAIVEDFVLFIGMLFIILVIKPVAAFIFVRACKFPLKVGLTVSLALAQIGEFSFILAEEANMLKLMPDKGYDIIVACSLISICLNPLFFKFLFNLYAKPQKNSFLKYLKGKNSAYSSVKAHEVNSKHVVVVGYGPVGQEVTKLIRLYNYKPTVIESNIDTVSKKESSDIRFVFGDASFATVLEAAKIDKAKYLIITMPNFESVQSMIELSREMNPQLEILVRVGYKADIPLVQSLKVRYICTENEAIEGFKREIATLFQKSF